MFKEQYTDYINALCLLILGAEMVSLLSLWLLGIWQIATPWTVINLLSYGFWKEALGAFLFISLIATLISLWVKDGAYRTCAEMAGGFAIVWLIIVVISLILLQMNTDFSLTNLDECRLFFLSRHDHPDEWDTFLDYHNKTSLMVAIGLAYLIFDRVKSGKFSIKKTEFDTKKFGTAVFEDHASLKKRLAYNPETGPLIGRDDLGTLHLPLLNKLTISPPGVGKTTTSTIPVLLTHEGAAFVFDVKGELWAVTARYRTEVMKRKVVAIDPFGVTQTADFQKGKPDALKTVYRFNPFDFIPNDPFERDRMINSFASSFVINDGGSSSHFDDNAKILIRGYIDYLMSRPKSERTMPGLFNLMSESIDDAMMTFEAMAACEGRAGAAANQISRVGQDERGSILSTSYRQIDWIGDRNIQKTLAESNFDLTDFIQGDMDIFVILPDDQTKEHNRLFRMVMSLIMSMIVKTPPSKLPKKKMLFLLEELAQLGACPDVEQCIEVMRARGVVVWSVFQSLKQIKLFSKPDLFLSVPIKQIFTNDDVETMKWIQELGGKKTVITKTMSINQGNTQQRTQTMGGQTSRGESESVQETGTDLLPLNEIRELPMDEQFVFVQGKKPLHCKKVRYFEHPFFAGRFDENPLEKGS